VPSDVPSATVIGVVLAAERRTGTATSVRAVSPSATVTSPTLTDGGSSSSSMVPVAWERVSVRPWEASVRTTV
jgi:hypothetical protein